MSDSPSTRLIRDFDPADRPREKALRYGFGALTNPELLAIILRTGTVGCPITQVCENLFNSVGNSFSMLMRKSLKELKLIDGVGDVKAQQILAIMELVKRFAAEDRNPGPMIIRNSKDIYELLKYDLYDKTHEEIWIVTLTRRNSVIVKHHLTSGSATASVFDVKGAIKKAILDDASGIIMAHNHPSGNLRPSPQDDNITRALKNAASTMDLRFLDHIIVTPSGYYSYADEGRL